MKFIVGCFLYTGIGGECSAHLINEGVVVDDDEVTVQWQGTGPSGANKNTQFECSLDGAAFNPCESPFLSHSPVLMNDSMPYIFEG